MENKNSNKCIRDFIRFLNQRKHQTNIFMWSYDDDDGDHVMIMYDDRESRYRYRVPCGIIHTLYTCVVYIGYMSAVHMMYPYVVS